MMNIRTEMHRCPWGPSTRNVESVIMSPKDRIAAAEASLHINVLGELNIRQMAESAVARSQRFVEIPARDVVNAPIFAADVESAICAVGVKHGLNIHPLIARDIAKYLRGPFAIEG